MNKAKRTELKGVCEDADAWIETSLKYQEPQWALSRDGGNLFYVMTTNALECFNGVLKGVQALPIQTLIARTFFLLVKFFQIRREITERWYTLLTPKNEDPLRYLRNMGRLHLIQRFNQTEWEVSNKEGYTYTVNLT